MEDAVRDVGSMVENTDKNKGDYETNERVVRRVLNETIRDEKLLQSRGLCRY